MLYKCEEIEETITIAAETETTKRHQQKLTENNILFVYRLNSFMLKPTLQEMHGIYIYVSSNFGISNAIFYKLKIAFLS